MGKQTLIWTALPNGIRNGRFLQLSTVLTPRLTSTRIKPTLEMDFPDLVNWPETVTGMEFRVQFANGPTYTAQRVSRPPDPELWRALFLPDTYVRSYKADEDTSTVVSYPVRNLLGYVSDRYRKLALEYPTRLPPASRLLDPDYFGEINVRGSLTAQVKQLQAQTRREQSAMVAQAMVAIAAANAPRQDREHKPIIAPPEESAGGRDSSPLPTGLAEHIRDTIDENRRQVGGEISKGFGGFAKTDPTAPLPDSKPATRPGQELPQELPIYFPIDHTPNPLRDFLKAGLFYLGLTPELSGDPEEREIQPMPMLPDFDFHQLISVLGDHPALMRQLGLIVDLEVELTADVPSLSLCRVLPTWSGQADTVIVSPWTYYEVSRSTGTFTPRRRPTNPDVRNGMLDLEDTQAFSLIQTDPDSAATGLLQRVNSVEPTDEDTGLPTLRSNGIALARSGAGILLLQTFVTNTAHNQMLANNPDQLAFYAEDLVQGYRPDIWWAKTGRWYSLTARQGTYEFLRAGRTDEVEDEGWVSLAATGGVSSASQDLHLHEMMFNWSGWSLVVPPPEPGDEEEDGETEDPDSQPLTALQVRTQFSVPPASLPSLRFGHTYRVRVRTVDLAGNSLPFVPAPVDPSKMDAEPGASEAVTYRRLEPVGSPAVIPPAPDWAPPPGDEPSKDTLTRGENVQRLVVRTYEAEMGSTGSMETSWRRLAPPRGSVKQAETHGVFDTAAGLDCDRYEAALDCDGDFPQVVAGEEALVVPYCPDPMARRICFKGLPGTGKDEVFIVDLYEGVEDPAKVWPDAKTITIKIDGDLKSGTAPVWSTDSRTLTVHVPLYEKYEVRVSSCFDPNDLDLFYLWHLMSKDLQDPVTKSKLEQLAKDGQHWMLTPGTPLTLLHASQKPKVGPVFVTAMAHRKVGETAAMLGARVKVHGKSTQAIQVFASWEEKVDDESLEEPVTSRFRGYACEERVRAQDLAAADAEDMCTLEVYNRHEWGDTRYRKVKYRAVATCRFTQYFDHERDPKIKDDPDAFKREGPEFEVDVLSTAPPAALQIEYVVPTFGWEKPKENVGDQIVSMRTGGGLRVYIKRPWYSSGDGEMLGVILSDELVGGRVPEAQRSFVTQWGKDPLWQADAPYPAPRIEHFRSAAAAQRGLTVEGTKVAVVGYPVKYDKARKLWYADVELDVGKAYFPFIRLALARYQPRAVEGCHLSDVILTDLIQVVPDRATSIRYISKTAESRVLQVTVSGDTYDRGPAGPA